MSRVRAVLGDTLLGQRAARPPVTSLHTGPAVPALALRLTLVALCLTASAVLGAAAAQLGVGIVVGLVIAVRPHAVLLTLGVTTLIGMYALVGQHGWQLPVIVAVTHALLQIGTVADAVAWRGRVELAVLRDVVPGFLTVQAVAQAATALALVLDGAPPLSWLVVGAVAALAVLYWALIGRIHGAEVDR